MLGLFPKAMNILGIILIKVSRFLFTSLLPTRMINFINYEIKNFMMCNLKDDLKNISKDFFKDNL